MSGQIRVTPEELRNMVNRYHDEEGNVEEVVGRLDGIMEELRNVWEGASSEAFAAQYEELKPSFLQMSDLLSDIARQLAESADRLEDVDEQIASSIRS